MALTGNGAEVIIHTDGEELSADRREATPASLAGNQLSGTFKLGLRGWETEVKKANHDGPKDTENMLLLAKRVGICVRSAWTAWCRIACVRRVASTCRWAASPCLVLFFLGPDCAASTKTRHRTKLLYIRTTFLPSSSVQINRVLFPQTSTVCLVCLVCLAVPCPAVSCRVVSQSPPMLRTSTSTRPTPR